MGTYVLLNEAGSPDGYELEDGTGVLILENVSNALHLICGAECGLNNDEGSSSVARHWADINGTVAIDTSIFRSGAKSFRFDAAATLPNLVHQGAAGLNILYGRFYFRVTDATPASSVVLCFGPNGGGNANIVLSTGGFLQASFGGTTQNGPAISADTWYGVEFEHNISANPFVTRWRTWDEGTGLWTTQTNNSAAFAANTFSGGISFGMVTGPTSGFTVYMDDILLAPGSIADEEYDAARSKGGSVLRYLPNADGAHSFVANDFQNTGVNLDPSSTTIYQALDEDSQTSTADYIAQVVAGAGKYIRIGFADESGQSMPRAVDVVSGHTSSATAANEMHMRGSDDGTNWTNLWGDWSSTGEDTGTTSLQTRSKVMEAPPSNSQGDWTTAMVNAFEIEWGNSDDVTPNPRLQNVSLEVEWDESGIIVASADENFPYIGGGYYPI